MKYILGIDLGTSYFKFALFDSDDKQCGLSRIAVEKDSGNCHLCELPSERFLAYIKEGISQACSNTDISPCEIESIGYSSQANSFILIDGDNKPLTPIILWPDNRAKEINPKVKELWNQPDFQQKTGIGIDVSPNFCVNKLQWFKNQQPGTWCNTKHVMTISDYLTFLFTGQKLGDMGTASLLGLLDCKAGKWWDKAFDILGLDKSLFSNPCQVGTNAGNLTKDISKLTGIRQSCSFFIGSLDHHMAAWGAGSVQIADMSESTGTVLACVNFTEKYETSKDVCVSPWKNNQYCQLTFDENGAASLEWYQKNFASEYPLNELIKMAEQVDSSDGLTAKPKAFLYYETMEQAFDGIEKSHTHGHFIRALMESSANTLAKLVNKLSPDRKPKNIVATGGGAKSELWLKIKSDFIGAEFIKAKYGEPACHGAALICGNDALIS